MSRYRIATNGRRFRIEEKVRRGWPWARFAQWEQHASTRGNFFTTREEAEVVLRPMQEEEAYGARVHAAYSREGRAWEAVEGMPERERKGHNEDESLAERIGLIVCMTCWVCFWVVVVVWEVMQ